MVIAALFLPTTLPGYDPLTGTSIDFTPGGGPGTGLGPSVGPWTVETVTVPTIPTDLSDAAVIYGKDTIKLTKDIYVSGPGPAAGDDSKELGDLYDPNSSKVASNTFVISVNPECLVAEIEKSRKVELTGKDGKKTTVTETQTITNIRDIKLDLNGHSIYSNSHVILAIDTVGSGKIVSSGKVAFAKGAVNNGIICISGDDLIIETSDRLAKPPPPPSPGPGGLLPGPPPAPSPAPEVPTTIIKGLLYSEDDIKFRPMSNTSVLRMGGQEVRIVKEFPVGSILSEDGSLTNPNNMYVGSPAAADPVTTQYDDYIMGGGLGIGGFGLFPYKAPPVIYLPPHDMKVERIEKSGGDYELLVTGIQPNSEGDNAPAALTIMVPPSHAYSPVNSMVSFVYGSAEDPHFYKILVKPEASGTCSTELLYEDDVPAPLSKLNKIKIKKDTFDLLGRQILYTFNNSMSKASIDMEGAIVCKNKFAGDPTEDRCYLDAGDQYKGYIKTAWSPEYMAAMVYLEGVNFKVRKISSHEIR